MIIEERPDTEFSPFDSLEDARRFIAWYESHDLFTAWDHDRYAIAKRLTATPPKSTSEILLAAILATPEDDAPRLAYADYLDEQGEAERAEFIRCQIFCGQFTDCPTRLADLKRGRPIPLRCGLCEYCVNRQRAGKLSHDFRLMPDSIAAYGFCLDPSPVDDFIPCGAGLEVVVTRGFAGSVYCRLSVWLAHGREIVRAHPVTICVAVDKYPEETPSGFSWFFIGMESDPATLPDDLLEDLRKCEGLAESMPPTHERITFATKNLADIALRISLINNTRKKVGLPTLGESRDENKT